MDGESRNVEAVMAAWAQRQHGNVTRQQLLEAGFSRTVIARRVQLGALHEHFRGVYLVGHRAAPPLAAECGAVLACRPQALVGRFSSARIWGIPVSEPNRVDITVVGRTRRPSPGIRVDSLTALGPGELRRYQGIPVASPALTLLQMAGELPPSSLAAAVNEARVQRLVTERELRLTLEHHPNRRGARALGRFLASDAAAFVIGSEAEARCLREMLAHGLRPDASQAQIGPFRVDFLFRAERLIVEVEGFRYHGQPHRYVRDRRRTAELMALGYEVFPVTWSDLVDDPRGAMERLRRTLARRRIERGIVA